MKKIKWIFWFIVLYPALVFAGTQDNLGVQGVWDKIQSWLTDDYVRRIVAAIFFVIGIMRATASILQFFIMLGFSVLFLNANTIIEKLTGATF